MNILKKMFLLVLVLSTWSCQQEVVISNDCNSEGQMIPVNFSYFEISGQDLNTCPFGGYEQGNQHWIIQSTAEYEDWKTSMDCSKNHLMPDIDFDKYTLLVGYVVHTDSGIILQNQNVSMCGNTYIYEVNFEDLDVGFTALTIKNYGVLVHKILSDSEIEVKINIQ